MNRILISIVLLISVVFSPAATLTASSTTPFTTVEFNADPNTSTGPDYNYVWLPSGYTHWVDGQDRTGPGWYVIEFDVDWNTVSESWNRDVYSIETICDVPLVSYYIEGITPGTQWFPTDGLSIFMADWISFSGTYDPCASPLRTRGKKLGHHK